MSMVQIHPVCVSLMMAGRWRLEEVGLCVEKLAIYHCEYTNVHVTCKGVTFEITDAAVGEMTAIIVGER